MADNIEMSGGSSPQQSSTSTSTSTATVTPPRMNPTLFAAIVPSSSSLQSRSTTSTASIAGKSTSTLFLIAVLSGVWLWIRNNRIAVFGASVTFAGCLIGLAALVPAFAGQQLTEEALELARWTALKDFVEQCWERKADGHVSADCEKAMDASLPPPPHMDVEKQMSRLVARIPSFQEVHLRIARGYTSIWSSVGIWHLAALLTVYGVLLLLWFQIIDRLRRSELRSVSGNDAALSSGRSLALDEEMAEHSLAMAPRSPVSFSQTNYTNYTGTNTSLSQADRHFSWMNSNAPSFDRIMRPPVTSPSEPGNLHPHSISASPLKHPYSDAYFSSGYPVASTPHLHDLSSSALPEMHAADRGGSSQDEPFDFDSLPSVVPAPVPERGQDASTQTDINSGNELAKLSDRLRTRPRRPDRETESAAARQRLRDRLAKPTDLHLARSGIVQRRQSRASNAESAYSSYPLPGISTAPVSEIHGGDMAMSSAVEYQNNPIVNGEMDPSMNYL